MIEVEDKQNLASQLEAHDKVMVFFCASWCPFCDRFIPISERYASKNGFVWFVRVYVDEDSNPLWEEYSLESVPTVILFEFGKVSARLDGHLGQGINEKQFNDWIRKLG